MTPAEIRALKAVDDGTVTRVYTTSDNTFRAPKGVGAATLWRLNRQSLITDGRGVGRWPTIFPVELTSLGRRVLAGSQ